MKRLSKIIFCIMICFINYSCGQNSQTLQADNTIQLNGKTYTLKQNLNIPIAKLNKSTENKITFHEVRDPQRNMVMGYLPIPNDWKIKDQVDKDGAYIFGPNNIRVYLPKANYYTYSELPGMNQMSAQAGQQVKPVMSVESLVQNELEPMFKKEGVKLAKQYYHTELQKYDENYDQFVFRAVPMRKEFKSYVTEWEDEKGNAFLFIIRYTVSYSQTGAFWGYYVNMMEAPKSYFEAAKQSYLYSLSNSKYNPQWLHACYMDEAKKASQRNEIHGQRMAMLRAEGDAIIQRGKDHSAMVDRNHKSFMDAHLERQTVSTVGTNYQVDAGSNVYWVNSNGEYIPTNDFNFDPNLDPNLNNQTWTKGNY